MYYLYLSNVNPEHSMMAVQADSVERLITSLLNDCRFQGAFVDAVYHEGKRVL